MRSAPVVSVLLLAFAPPVAARSKVVLFPVTPLVGEVELMPAQLMTRVIADELHQEQGIDVVVGRETPAAALAAPEKAPAGRDNEYRAAMARLTEGEKLAERLRFPQAMRSLSKAIDGLTRNLDQIDPYERLLDAYVLLAACHFRRGRQASGAELLEWVARLRPDYEMDRSKYPPVFTSVYEQARQRVLARARGALRVTSAPSGAEVVLNGRSLGTTPLVVEEVAAGEAHLVVKGAGRVVARSVTVREGAIEETHMALGVGLGGDSLADALAANRFDRDTRKLARALAKDAGGDFVVLAVMAKNDGLYVIAGFLGNTHTGKWTVLEPAAPDYDLFSDTLEGHRLASDVGRRVRGEFGVAVADDALPFVAGKALHSGGVASLREARVSFGAPTAVTTRAPVTPEPAPVERPAEPIALVPPPVEPAPETRAVGALPVDSGRGGPPARADVRAQAREGGIMDSAWFWPVVAGVAVAAAGTTVYLVFLRDRDPSSVKVHAVW